jgi:glycosyltransferase involved in cell wall biosynthesis
MGFNYTKIQSGDRIMKRKKLVIISHTEHFYSKGEIVGWGATINEVNFIADYWDEVVHVACLHKKDVPKSSLPYSKKNIFFQSIPPYGGKKILDKILILFKIPIIIITVLKSIKGASEVQLRLPTSMGLFLLPMFSFIIPRKFTFWVKYAGDWNQKKPPFSNRLQRYWLRKNWSKCNVTINGFWQNQPSHCKSFENPCLTKEDILNGDKIAKNKKFQKPFTFCFVGRMDEVKGIPKIIDSFKGVSSEDIKVIHMIGDGIDFHIYKEDSKYLSDKIIFHGFQDRNYVHKYLKEAHFFLLPSSAEGFPKVVAEAACYGVIPIVSNVGSISHYIDETNGFVWNIKNNKITYESILKKAIDSNSNELNIKSNKILNVSSLFTFDNYLQKLKSNILEK